jgi:hypothetical protein
VLLNIWDEWNNSCLRTKGVSSNAVNLMLDLRSAHWLCLTQAAVRHMQIPPQLNTSVAIAKMRDDVMTHRFSRGFASSMEWVQVHQDQVTWTALEDSCSASGLVTAHGMGYSNTAEAFVALKVRLDMCLQTV